jgi:hypothetical protein
LQPVCEELAEVVVGLLDEVLGSLFVFAQDMLIIIRERVDLVSVVGVFDLLEYVFSLIVSLP